MERHHFEAELAGAAQPAADDGRPGRGARAPRGPRAHPPAARRTRSASSPPTTRSTTSRWTIDDRCLRLLATQTPLACDLRLITSAMKINADLERIGDQAVNIAESVLALIPQPPLKPLIDIPRMAAIAEKMIRDALDAFVKKDAELARDVLRRDDEVDELKDQVFRELLTYMMADPGTIQRALSLILISRNLERIADHATNIAEDVIFITEAKDVRHHAGAGEAVRAAARAPRRERPRPAAGRRRHAAPRGADRGRAATSPRRSRTSSRRSGLQVRVARTGEEGLEAVRRGADLVLLDLNLPGMDGLEVCRMIRRQQTTAHVPIIIVSARGGGGRPRARPRDGRRRLRGEAVQPEGARRAGQGRAAPRERRATRPRRATATRTGRSSSTPTSCATAARRSGSRTRSSSSSATWSSAPGRVLTRERLLERVWGWESDVDARSIDAHIRRLRAEARPRPRPRGDGRRPRLPLREVGAGSHSRAAESWALVTSSQPIGVAVVTAASLACRSAGRSVAARWSSCGRGREASTGSALISGRSSLSSCPATGAPGPLA